MAHVLVLQNLSFDGPAYLADWLREQGCHVDVRNNEEGDAYPERLDGYQALALLGGEMSANDDMPHLRRAEALFREALRRGVPTIGHCLGGQLMSRALGASVHASPAPEVGWHAMSIQADSPWFGGRREAVVMQWHNEAFDVPAGVGAVPLAGSAQCPVQAWALGPHLAMQFHIEVDAAKVRVWCDDDDGRGCGAPNTCPTVHPTARIRADLETHLGAHQAMARDLYRHWLSHWGP